MKSLREQIECCCVHFNGTQYASCKAGVVYADVKDESQVGRGRFPCWRDSESLPCDQRRYPTPEEVAAEIAEIEESSNRLNIAIGACRKDAATHGYKKGNGGVGKIACPCCTTGTLHYSVAGYNGHMHGQCTTPECMSWMQ